MGGDATSVELDLLLLTWLLLRGLDTACIIMYTLMLIKTTATKAPNAKYSFRLVKDSLAGISSGTSGATLLVSAGATSPGKED